MHPTFRPIDQLTQEWEAIRRSDRSRVALQRLAAVEPEVADLSAADLHDLVEGLRQPHSRASREASARIIQAMLRSEAVDPLISRAILQAILPGLVTVARRLAWGAGGDWTHGGAFFADLLATAWEVIIEWSGQDRAYAVLDLLSAVRCRSRRQLLRQRTTRRETLLDPDLASHATSYPFGRTALDDLAIAIDNLSGHGLDPADAAVLYGHRVLGLSINELANISGESRRRLERRRDRAEREICA